MTGPPRDLWPRIEPILERAFELEPQAQVAYLAAACRGEEQLRREVEKILAADREAGDFLSGVVGDVGPDLFRELEPKAPAAELREDGELGPYRVGRRLGGGGMGLVHEAEDPRLGRRVALKVLPPEVAGDAGRLERFEREARAVAALNHPNIVTIYSVEGSRAGPLLTMELIEGRTLDELVPQAGMNLGGFLELALPLADAVAAAHEKGITHRDLKPANLMVTREGRLKVLDFGLAKLRRPAPAGADPTASRTMTSAGAILGTMPYMSPEQAEGKPVDRRTDLFSLGTLYYEMLTGKRPFHGDTPAALVSSILRDEPRPLGELRSDLPAVLTELVERCLEKDAERRWPTARQLRDELEGLKRQVESERFLADSGSARSDRAERRGKFLIAVAGAALAAALGVSLWYAESSTEVATPEPAPPIFEPRAPRTRIVVLAFDSIGPAADDYFAAGMTEEIHSRLAAVRDLAVISRQSAQVYARRQATVTEIGKELNVDYVLEGTVRWERPAGGPSRMRIAPELIRVADDTLVWSHVYERDLAGVFALQSEIGEQVAAELGVTLLETEGAAMRARPTENLEAYQAYLRGRAFRARFQNYLRDWALAAESFDQAVELDPGFALAWAALSRIRSRLSSILKHPADREVAARAARRALEQSLELAPEAPEVQLAQGIYHYKVEQDEKRALEVFNGLASARPNDARALAWRGYILRNQGRWEESLALLEHAAELDPLNSNLLAQLGFFSYAVMHRFGQAMEISDRLIAMAPDQRLLYDGKAYVLLAWTGDVEKAREILEILPAENHFSQMMDFYLELFAGDYPAALDRLAVIEGEWVEGRMFGRWPKKLLEGQVRELLDEPGRAAGAFTEALSLAEEAVRGRPDDAQLYSVLGIAHAALGRGKEALEAGERAVDLAASSVAAAPLRRLKDLAIIYTRVGEDELALDALDRLLSEPFDQLTVPLLELEPWWQPLREHPRYRTLIEAFAAQLPTGSGSLSARGRNMGEAPSARTPPSRPPTSP